MTVREWTCAALFIAGALLKFLAALGVLRMPDLFLRMSATSKASTLGTGLMAAAAAVYFGDTSTIVRALAIVVFVFVTAPVAAHMIGRAAYFDGVPLWRGTVSDELRGRYDRRTHALGGEERQA